MREREREWSVSLCKTEYKTENLPGHQLTKERRRISTGAQATPVWNPFSALSACTSAQGHSGPSEVGAFPPKEAQKDTGHAPVPEVPPPPSRYAAQSGLSRDGSPPPPPRSGAFRPRSPGRRAPSITHDARLSTKPLQTGGTDAFCMKQESHSQPKCGLFKICIISPWVREDCSPVPPPRLRPRPPQPNPPFREEDMTTGSQNPSTRKRIRQDLKVQFCLN